MTLVPVVEPPDGCVRVGRVEASCDVLGPDRRAVLWVAGCPLRCAECIAPEWLAFTSGELVPIDALVEQLLAEHPDGVTYSGGEPFWQPEALSALTDALRRITPELSLVSYSGLTLEWLQQRGSDAQRALLDRLDLLIDGPYVAARHASLRWRGSSNQRIRVLSDRHADVRNAPDVSVGMQFRVTDGVEFMGVPAMRGFRERLARMFWEEGLEEDAR